MSDMTLRSFHNGLRILTSIDRHELVEANVIDEDDEVEWPIFRSNPHKWMILADADQLAALWGVMKKRGA